MKSEKDVRRRLKKLRLSMLRRRLKSSQDRTPSNCVHNHVHFGSRNGSPDSAPPPRLSSPTRSSSLVVLQDPPSVRLCMYGSENPAEWAGLVCDSEDVSRRCKWFCPKESSRDAVGSTMAMLADDKYVFDNHKDLAALQWVLGERVHAYQLSWWERLVLFLSSLLVRKVPPLPELPEPVLSDSDLEAIWNDDHPQDS